MKSYEAIQRAIAGKTVEQAKALHKSTPLLNKWQEPSTNYEDSGAYNPLDRIETIISTALALGISFNDASAPVRYLEERFGIVGIRVTAPLAGRNEICQELMNTISEFSRLTDTAARALKDEKITKREYEQIHNKGWDLIRQVTAFMYKTKEAVA